MKVEKINSYHNSGCDIYPLPNETLYVIKYWEYSKNLPNSGKFGSMSCFDGLEFAKELADKIFGKGKWNLKLDLPDLVFTV